MQLAGNYGGPKRQVPERGTTTRWPGATFIAHTGVLH